MASENNFLYISSLKQQQSNILLWHLYRLSSYHGSILKGEQWVVNSSVKSSCKYVDECTGYRPLVFCNSMHGSGSQPVHHDTFGGLT